MKKTDSQSIQINSSSDSVWKVLTTIAGISDWYDGWDTVEHEEPNHRDLSQGARFRLIRDRGGHVETARCVVSVFEPSRRLGWIEDGPHGRTVLVNFRLDTDPTGGTVLTLSKTF